MSWIEQAKTQGHGFGDALRLASELAWGGAYYSPRTLEGWYYEHQKKGFEALVPKIRSDKGQTRALCAEAQEAIVTLRQQHPGLQVTALVEQLEKQGVLQTGAYSLASIYRLLDRHGLDRQKLRAQAQTGNPNGPTKAFELPYANALWMADVMYGPVLSIIDSQTGKKRAVQSYLFGLIDDCSRLAPHAQYYPEQNVRALTRRDEASLRAPRHPGEALHRQRKNLSVPPLQARLRQPRHPAHPCQALRGLEQGVDCMMHFIGWIRERARSVQQWAVNRERCLMI